MAKRSLAGATKAEGGGQARGDRWDHGDSVSRDGSWRGRQPAVTPARLSPESESERAREIVRPPGRSRGTRGTRGTRILAFTVAQAKPMHFSAM